MTTTEMRPASPPVDRPRSKREIYLVMSGLMIGMLLSMLDNLVVGTAMPTIVGELGGLTHLSWVVTAYTLATAVATPVWAKLGDLYGRKGMYLASIVVFLAGSALSGLSRNMNELISFRGLQGLGAGGLAVGAMAIIADLVPPRERGRYQGMMTAVMPVAFIGGPLLGGFLTDHLSWRWAFYINLPLGVLALAVVALTMHIPGRRPEKVRIDWAGAALLSAGIAALTLLTSWGGTQYAWTSAPIVGLGVVTVLALAGFIAVERRVAEPILSLTLFRRRNFSAATMLTLFIGFALFGAMTFLPQFQQNVQGASATSSGLLLLPLMAGMLTTSLLGGQLVTRTGRYRTQLIVGAVLLIAGLGLLATMGTTTTALSTSTYMVVLGAGMGLLMQTTQMVAQNSVAQRDVGAASGAVTLFRTLGGSLGVSLLGTLFAQQVAAALASGGAPAGQLGSGHLTPAMLERLPAPLREAYQSAITSGVHQVFLWGAVIAVLGLLAAWTIREVPLRSAEPMAVTGGAMVTASAAGHQPVVSRIPVTSDPVMHEIVLPDPGSVTEPGVRSWRTPGLALVGTASAALILAVTVSLWPASTGSSAAPSIQAPPVAQQQPPVVPQPANAPATTVTDQGTPPRSTTSHPRTVAIDHHSSAPATSAPILVLHEVTTRWQPTPTPRRSGQSPIGAEWRSVAGLSR